MVLYRIKQHAKRMLPRPLARAGANANRGRRSGERPRFTSRQDGDSKTLDCCVAYTENGGFCVPLSSRHRPAARKILEGLVYEPETIEFLAKNCGEGDVVHAGTYFGDFLPALSRSCAPGALVWAFEPNPENYRCALVTCIINDLGNVRLTNAGLGEQQATMMMMTRDAEGRGLGGASHLVEQLEDDVPVTHETVDIVAVDDVVPVDREVSIIQLDVEGHEKQALLGALKTIERCLPVIVLETVPEDAWLAENVARFGYSVDRNIHGNTVLVPSSPSTDA
jgi:FkbM family methyltransferase